MKLLHINGEHLYNAFFFGRKQVVSRQRHLNRINVFPVADGDTGTNLAMTMHSIIEGSCTGKSVAGVSSCMAEAALLGSRGNSGIIFAQFVHGLSLAVKGKETLNARDFTLAMRSAVDQAYLALAKPVEGTILTVMRTWANALHGLHHNMDDVVELVHRALEPTKQALAETRKKLKVLDKAGVVDAGAAGFVAFLEGMAHSLRHQLKPDAGAISGLITDQADSHPVDRNAVIPFRYCTEALIEGTRLDRSAIRNRLQGLGDSIVVAGSDSMMKVHLHTNSPAEVGAVFSAFGLIIRNKVDDMRRQHEAHHRRISQIAIVTDSSCDLPQDILDRHQIHVVPLHIAFGRNQYLDKLSITPERFYDMLDSEPDFPTTSQPSVSAFETLYRDLLSHYDSVISVHLSGGLSGTFNSARLAAGKFSQEAVSVIDSRHISSTLGLIVLRLAQGIENGLNRKDAARFAESLVPNTRIWVSVQSLASMVKSGRVSPLKGRLANILNLKPVVSLDSEGKAVLSGKAFSERSNQAKIIQEVHEWRLRHGIRMYVVGYTSSKRDAESFAERLENKLGIKPAFITPVSPAIGTHAGAGSLAVCVLSEPKAV